MLDDPTAEPAEERRLELLTETARVNAFSDGVFAVAATLLVLGIAVPDIPGHRAAAELPHALAGLLGPLFSYLLSFAVIGLFWLRHHQLFDRLRGSNQRLAVINLVFLAFVALLPLSTALLGRYGNLALPVAIYAANVVLLSLLMGRLSALAGRMRLLDARGVDRRGAVRGLVAIAAFALSIPVAFLDADVAKGLWGLTALTPLVTRGLGV